MATPLITREMELPAILTRYPSCRPIFDRYGLTGCGGELGDPGGIVLDTAGALYVAETALHRIIRISGQR